MNVVDITPSQSIATASQASNESVTLRFKREIDLLLMLYIAIIVFGILYPSSFLSTGNLSAILNDVAAQGIIAIGMMLLLISGAFDLSVGSMCSLCGVICGFAMVQWGLHPVIAVPLALTCAAMGGALNGFLVARVKVNPMITTLGTLGIFKGIAVLIGGPGISDLPTSFTWFGQTGIMGVQWPFLVMIVLALVAQFASQRVRFMRQFYYVGSNAKAAKLSGMNVEKLQWIAFTTSAVLAGIAGLAMAARFGATLSTAGDGKELQVITAVVLGGASLQGGKGNIIGGIIGVVFMAVVGDLLIISKVSSYWHSIVVGGILIAAVAYDSLQRKQR
jgi:ribose transport system permease protein